MPSRIPFDSHSSFKLLIQRADRLGDVVNITRVIDTLRVNFKHIHIDVLTSPLGKSYLCDYPGVRHIICTKDDQGHSKSFFSIAADVRARKYDVYMNLFEMSRWAHLGLMCGIKYRIGAACFVSLRYCFTHRVNANYHDITQHQSVQNLRFLDAFSLTKPVPPTCVVSDNERRLNARKKMRKFLPPNHHRIFLFSDSGGSNQPIGKALVANIAKDISRSNEFTLVFCVPLGQQASDYDIHLPNVMFLENADIQELKAFILESDIYIGPDTGPTHIASYAQKPMVVVSPNLKQFPSRWGPLSPYFSIIRHITTDASIHSEDVLRRVNELISLKNVGEAMSPTEQENQRLMASFRILALCRTLEEYNQAFIESRKLRMKGLIIFPLLIRPYSLRSLRHVLRYVSRHCITIIQGHCPMWMLKAIQCIRGPIQQSVQPRYVGQIPVSSTIDVADYISIYKYVWRQQ